MGLEIALGIDPGKKNCAVAVVTKKGNNIKVIGTAMIFKPLSCIQGQSSDQEMKFALETWEELLSAYKPTMVCTERFMVRGRFFGAQSEIISFSNGMLKVVCYKNNVDFKTIASTTWKSEVKRCGVDLEKAVYPWAKTKKIPPHRVDSLLIATWIIMKGDLRALGKSRLWSIIKQAGRVLQG